MCAQKPERYGPLASRIGGSFGFTQTGNVVFHPLFQKKKKKIIVLRPPEPL